MRCEEDRRSAPHEKIHAVEHRAAVVWNTPVVGKFVRVHSSQRYERTYPLHPSPIQGSNRDARQRKY